jgi:hypothetical protein
MQHLAAVQRVQSFPDQKCLVEQVFNLFAAQVRTPVPPGVTVFMNAMAKKCSREAKSALRKWDRLLLSMFPAI